MQENTCATRTAVPRRLASALVITSLLSVVCLAAEAPQPQSDPQVQKVVVGPNVNMVGGPTSFDPDTGLVALPLIGDPFLQRQNEPSIAVSSRNRCHILGGANDYRSVNLEQVLLDNPELGDAWLGVYKSTNCGATWTSELFYGHPVDATPEGLASPLRGLTAGADPVVRAGTSGMFYMTGLAFDREDKGISKIFVARWIDNNNTDGADPFKYINTKVVAAAGTAAGGLEGGHAVSPTPFLARPVGTGGTAEFPAHIDMKAAAIVTTSRGDGDGAQDGGRSNQFLDKPWFATDIPRSSATCTVDGQTFPAGNAYLAYTVFVGDKKTGVTEIRFSKSTDCGETWSEPMKISGSSIEKNQGTSIAVDPGTGHVYVVWREFTEDRDAIVFVKSTDAGSTFSPAARIEPEGYRMQPFDQISSFATFRTNAYPTLAIVPAEAEGRPANEPGRVYVAWAARGFVAAGPNQGLLTAIPPGDARIVYSTYVDGWQDWSPPVMADPVMEGGGHQVMPAMAFSGGKLALAYYDLREDRFARSEDLVFEGGLSNFLACRQAQENGTLVGTVLQCLQQRAAGSSRHTIDLRGALVDAACLAAGDCSFASTSVFSTRVSRYASRAGVRLQYNPPNLPLFSKGRFPFIGDYIDVAAL